MVARGATYLHSLLLWVGGASFPATLCKNGLFLCFMLLAYSIYTEGILKLYLSHTEWMAGSPFSVFLSSLSVTLRDKRMKPIRHFQMCDGRFVYFRSKRIKNVYKDDVLSALRHKSAMGYWKRVSGCCMFVVWTTFFWIHGIAGIVRSYDFLSAAFLLRCFAEYK